MQRDLLLLSEMIGASERIIPVPKASTLQSPDHLRAPTGLGLRIVEEISASWGADATPDGKTVWFDVDVHEVPAG